MVFTVIFSFEKLPPFFIFSSIRSSFNRNGILVQKLASTFPCIWVNNHVLENQLPLVCMEVAILASVSNLTLFVGCSHVLRQISLYLCLVITLTTIENIGAVHNSSMINHVAVTAELNIAKLANMCHIHMLCPKMMPYVDT